MVSLARKFTDREVRSLLEKEQILKKSHLQEIVRKAEELGVHEIDLQEREESLLLRAVWVEELSRACLALGVLLATHFRASMPLLLCPEENAQHLLKAPLKQKLLFTTTLAPFAPPGEFRLDRESLLLSGEIEQLCGVDLADSFCVYAQNKEGGTELVWLPKETANLTCSADEPMMGLEELGFSKVSLRECCLKEAFCMPFSLETAKAIALSEGFLLSSLVGASKEAQAIASRYAEKRYQGGDLICRHDAIKAMLAEMEMNIAIMETITDEAFRSPSPKNFCFTAYAAQASEKICLDAIQILGGYGYMKDFRLEKILRDCKTLQLLLQPRERLTQNDLEELKKRRRR